VFWGAAAVAALWAVIASVGAVAAANASEHA